MKTLSILTATTLFAVCVSGTSSLHAQQKAPRTVQAVVVGPAMQTVVIEALAQKVKPEPVVGSVPLETWERKALKEYYALIRTPRGATRLLNTYRLVRAGVPSDEWGTFRGEKGRQGEYLVAMLLLAVAAGQPAIARDWFYLLRTRVSSDLPGIDQIPAQNRTEWQKFEEIYENSSRAMSMTWTPELMKKWLDRVERFSF